MPRARTLVSAVAALLATALITSSTLASAAVSNPLLAVAPARSADLTSSLPTLLPVAPAVERRYSDGFILDGMVESPRSYHLDDLRALPSEEVAVEFRVGSEQRRATYRGVRLYDLLMAAKPMINPAVPNDALGWYVHIGATDHYAATIAWGEIDPGWQGKRVLVAYEEDGKLLGQEDGMARLVVPGDRAGGRYVSNIVSIALLRSDERAVIGETAGTRADLLPRHPLVARSFSPSFLLGGMTGESKTVTLDDLRALPSEQITVEYLIGGRREQHTYRGIRLYDLAVSVSPKFIPTVRNDALSWYVQVNASDNYQATIAWGEIAPTFEGKSVLVAYEEDGKLLGERDGMARLVVPGDLRGGRYVSNITGISVLQSYMMGR